MEKNEIQCLSCKKFIKVTFNQRPFNQHMALHDNPSSVLCDKFYKKYFHKIDKIQSKCIYCGKVLKFFNKKNNQELKYYLHLGKCIKMNLKLIEKSM